MSEHFNGLTPAEAERLAWLIEELAEAQRIACKILRHGYESYDPTVPISRRVSNRNVLEKELGHVYAAIALLAGNEDVTDEGMADASSEKHVTVLRWMHHQ